MKMRILSMLLAFAMLFGMMPAVAFAEETEPTEVTVPVEATESALPMQTDYLSAVHVNPLYADVIDDSEVEYFFHKNEVFYSGAETIADDKVYHTDLSEVVPEFREFMEQRGEVFTFSYIIPIENFTKDYLGELLGELIEAASAHTGVPTQGDYIKWHYKMGSIGASGKQYSGAEVINADVTIQMQYYSTAAQEAAVTSRVDSLLSELSPTGTDYQKIKTVYDWMCENIEYDYDNLNDSTYNLKYSAYAALINGTSVCQGYANLLYRFALEMGIDCRIITGYSANGSGTPEAHAWNIVKLGDYYYNLDATWDSARTTPVYFLKSQATFENHYRNSDYTTSAFNAAYPMGAEDYDPSQDVVEDENIIASGTCGENVTWTLDKEGTLMVSGSGAMTNYTTRSAVPWYSFQKSIVNLVIENGVTTIGDQAFSDCNKLIDVVIPNGITTIGEHAFENCTGITSASIPDSVTSIGEWAFYRCVSLTNVTIPEGVTTIGELTFYGCRSLEAVIIPSGVKQIGFEAFDHCKSLTVVHIPESVSNIGNYAFGNCDNLKQVIFLGDAPSIANVAFENVTATMFYPCGKTSWKSDVLRNYGGTITWTLNHAEFVDGVCTSCQEVQIQDSGKCGENLMWKLDVLGTLTIMGSGSMYKWSDSEVAPWFGYRTSIKYVEMCEGVTSVGNYAFYGCKSITSVQLPNSLSSIGNFAFYYCSNLASMCVPDGVTDIGHCAFSDCNGLTSVQLPRDITEIAYRVFDNCSNLTNITIPDGVTNIEESAFSGCSNLANIAIPNSVTNIGMHAFNNCAKLVCIEIPDSVTQIGRYTFYGCSSLTRVEIPAGLISIGDAAFSGCSSLTSIKLPDGLVSIDSDAFRDCSSLAGIAIPDGVTNIDRATFWNCNSLTSVVIPSSITNIASYAFYNCSGLEEILFTGNAPTIADNAFMRVETDAYYPADNATWTNEVMQNYGGEITWKPSCASHIWDTGAVTTEPTEESTGVRTYTCTRCGETKTETIPVLEHTHKHSASVTAPTCTEKGYTTYTCACGDTYVADEVPALDHDMGDWVITDATCTADGSKTRACSRCDFTETEVITAPGHTHVPVVTAPTCTEKGYTTYTCACGDTYLADEVPALNHDLGDWVIIDATCTVDGIKTRACCHCDYTETEVITAPGHSHVPEVTAPTCTEKGYTTYTCACGDSYVADETAALGHNHAYSMTKAPTESVSGSITGICTRCGDEVSVTLPKLNKDDYTYEVELEPTEEAEGIAHYLWKNTDYGVYSFDVVLNKLAAALGDVSGDGEINVLDLMYLANYFAKGETINKENADVNKDGSLDVRDLMFLANVFAGKETLK